MFYHNMWQIGIMLKSHWKRGLDQARPNINTIQCYKVRGFWFGSTVYSIYSMDSDLSTAFITYPTFEQLRPSHTRNLEVQMYQ